MFRRFVLSLVCLIWAASSAFAADAQTRFAIKGAGRAPCSSFMEAYQARSQDAYLYAGWVTGYLTAINQSTEGTFDIAPWQSPDVLMLLLNDICRRDPQQQVYKAVITLTGILGRERLETYSEPVEIENGSHKVALYGDVLKTVQERLRATNHYSGSIDGSYGPGTRKAIESFQKDKGLEVTGVPDQKTMLMLMYAPGRN